MRCVNLSLTPDRLAICQLSAEALLPVWATAATGFLAIIRTGEELSIVCEESGVPADVRQETGWRALKVEGPLEFSLTGILASIAAPLAQAGVSIFALSTYNTDYVLVKHDKVDAAVRALHAAGHNVRTE